MLIRTQCVMPRSCEDNGQANEDPRTIQMFDFATFTWLQVLTEGDSPGDQAHVQVCLCHSLVPVNNLREVSVCVAARF